MKDTIIKEAQPLIEELIQQLIQSEPIETLLGIQGTAILTGRAPEYQGELLDSVFRKALTTAYNSRQSEIDAAREEGRAQERRKSYRIIALILKSLGKTEIAVPDADVASFDEIESFYDPTTINTIIRLNRLVIGGFCVSVYTLDR